MFSKETLHMKGLMKKVGLRTGTPRRCAKQGKRSAESSVSILMRSQASRSFHCGGSNGMARCASGEAVGNAPVACSSFGDACTPHQPK